MLPSSYSPTLQMMVDRAATLTVEEIAALGDFWETDEQLVLPKPSIGLELQGYINVPVVTNMALVDAWQRALDAAGKAGRVEEIDAAIAAGRGTHKDDRHLDDTPSEKSGSEEAVRSAVLAVGVRDLISEADFETLVGPWLQILGDSFDNPSEHRSPPNS